MHHDRYNKARFQDVSLQYGLLETTKEAFSVNPITLGRLDEFDQFFQTNMQKSLHYGVRFKQLIRGEGVGNPEKEEFHCRNDQRGQGR